MQIHHVNCATMCPRAPEFLGGGCFVCHCLVVETPNSGLVLVDTGLGTEDVEQSGRLPFSFRAFLAPEFDRSETALEQIRALGYDRDDVRHLVVTHMDLDHAGGLPDFPEATVHLHRPERESIETPPSGLFTGDRRISEHWEHGPNWSTYTPEGEEWFGFEAVRGLDGLPPEILIVPLAGHTVGHSGVALRGDDGWLLHAGDAYFKHGEVVDGSCPALIRTFQSLIEEDREARLRNQRRLRELNEEGEVDIFSAHDAEEFEARR